MGAVPSVPSACCSSQEKPPADRNMIAAFEATPVVDDPLRPETCWEDIFDEEPEDAALTEKIKALADKIDTASAQRLAPEESWVGDHQCERVKDEACLQKFDNEGTLPKLVELLKDRILQDFNEDPQQQQLLDSLYGAKGAETLFAYSVSDPTCPDCPLVFVSHGFAHATGYPVDFAIGRSCRFLQPTLAVINDAFNMEERKSMRSFCMEPLPHGTARVNLLLNERSDGKRFWNLLKMEHVMNGSSFYIIGVQTVVDAYMPKVMKTRVNQTAKTLKWEGDPRMNEEALRSRKNEVDVGKKIVKGLHAFLQDLSQLRTEISASTASIVEMKKHVTDKLNSMKPKKTNAAKGKSNKKMDSKKSKKATVTSTATF